MGNRKKRRCRKCIWFDVCNTERRKDKLINCEYYYPVDEDEDNDDIIETHRREYREEYIEYREEYIEDEE